MSDVLPSGGGSSSESDDGSPKSDSLSAKRGIYAMWQPPLSHVENSPIWVGFLWLAERAEGVLWFVDNNSNFHWMDWMDWFWKNGPIRGAVMHTNFFCFGCPYHVLLITLSDKAISFAQKCGLHALDFHMSFPKNRQLTFFECLTHKMFMLSCCRISIKRNSFTTPQVT